MALMSMGCSASKKFQKSLPVQIENSFVFQKSFTGFALFDPEKGEMIYEYNSDKYFTPASNTKLFTFYTALKVLGDSLPVLEYIETGDSLLFWGTGNPAFLNPALPQDSIALNFLKNNEKQLFFCPSNFQEARFGPGWAWDDYPYYYQPERSPFPIYGNVVQFEKDSMKKGFEVIPFLFKNRLQLDADLGGEEPLVTRREDENIFEYKGKAVTGKSYQVEIPFKYSDSLFLKLLQDTLKREVELLDVKRLPPADAKRLFSANSEDLYRQLMQHSDNFIAEQLMLMCSNKLFDTLNVAQAIQFAKDSLLQDAPDELLWVDGSGLSRYNMFTPRTVVKVLEKIRQTIPQDRLFDILAAGGLSGTIKNWYGGQTPYVFAKTGSLRNKHCLSGYLVTKKRKTLVFSFMHNNFKGSAAPLKREMERILQSIYEQN